MNRTPLSVALLSDHEGLTSLVGQAATVSDLAPVNHRVARDIEELLSLIDQERYDAVVVGPLSCPHMPLDIVRAVRRRVSALPVLLILERGRRDGVPEADDVLLLDEVTPAHLARRIACTAERRFLVGQIHRLTSEGPALSEEPFRRLIEANADGIIIAGQDGRVRFVNPAAEQLLGAIERELAGTQFGYALDPGTTAEISLPPAGKNEPPGTAEMRVVETNWRGEVVYLASLRDISERKRQEDLLREYRDRLEAMVAERTEELSRANSELEAQITALREAREALVRSESRSRALLSTIPDMMFLVTREGDCLGFNAPDSTALLVAPEKIIGSNIRDMGLEEATASEMLATVKRTLKTGKVETYHYSVRIAERNRSFEARMIPSGPDEVLCIVRDTTDLERAKRALEASERHYRGIFESAPVGIFHTTPEGKVLCANPALARTFGYDSPEDFISTVNRTTIAETVYVDPDQRPGQIGSAIEYGDWRVFNNRYYRKDGEIFVGRTMYRVVADEDGKPHHLAGFIEDITDHGAADDYRP